MPYDDQVRSITSPSRLVLLASVLALAGCPLGCRSGGSSGGGSDRAERLVVVSYDSVGADLAATWLADGTARRPDGLRGFADQGFAAGRVRPVNPTLTAVVHNALVTGAPPRNTGIVSNTFLPAGAPVTRFTSGFAAPSAVAPLWAGAKAAGRRTGILLWPGSDVSALDRMGDFGMWWPRRPLVDGEILELDPADAVPAPDLPTHDGLPSLAWTIPVELPGSQPSLVRFEVAITDSDENGRPRYDTIAFRPAGGDGWDYREDRGWYRFDNRLLGPEDLEVELYGSWCKVLHLDRWDGHLRLYRGGLWRLHAYPASFASGLEEAIGPWPGEPDSAGLEAWWLDATTGIDLDVWLEQAERLDAWLDDAFRYVVDHEDFDLLFAYHPIVDEYLHMGLLVRPGQWAFSPGRAVAAREGLRRVGRTVDASISATWRLLEPTQDALVVVSDHGQAPIERTVRVNRLLADAGLLEVVAGDRGPEIGPASRVVATGDGGCAHLYLNRADSRPGGVVAASDAPELERRVARLLADLENGGDPLVERVVTRAEAASLGLDHPNSGDLVAFLLPGSTFSMELEGPAVEPSRFYGQHGYLAHHDAMCGIAFARGAGIRRSRPSEVTSLDVARRIALWAGL
jgi:predicted AlkP superfamily pyrophosphatase or phosphodiesterase